MEKETPYLYIADTSFIQSKFLFCRVALPVTWSHCFQNKLVAVNPLGTHLSSDEIPLPLIYTVINLIWATLMAAWFFNWVIYFKVSVLSRFPRRSYKVL